MLQLQKLGHRELERYYPLLETDFDSEELLPRLAVHRGMLNGSLEFLTLRDDQSGFDAGYALVLTKNLYGYVDLKYMAVMPWFRGRGLGVQPPGISLGNIMGDGKNYISTHWWITAMTGFLIVIMAIALTLIGDALHKHFDPKLSN